MLGQQNLYNQGFQERLPEISSGEVVQDHHLMVINLPQEVYKQELPWQLILLSLNHQRQVNGTANRGRNTRGSGMRGRSSLSRNSQYDSRGPTQVNCWGCGGPQFQHDCPEASLSILQRTEKEPISM